MSDWLNNNQGVLAGVGLLLTIGGYFSFKNKQVIKNKVLNSPHIEARSVQAGGDIIVSNNTSLKEKHPERPYVEIYIDMVASDGNSYEVTFGFRNVGKETAVLRSLALVDENIHSFNKSLVQNETARAMANLQRSKIRMKKYDDKVLKLTYSGLDGSKFATLAQIQQGLRADGLFNVEKITDCEYIDD